eukprot:TRINITY_DN11569_c0_g1_i2.p1 TRINITY_DN11569_c0_g1~~TRINITY_DN11569_c0_g1_i2.p1  ORF type:complete len:501 (+),score=83.60 TRINITY_DN11569_c0_g1_i2:28-1503(+)
MPSFPVRKLPGYGLAVDPTPTPPYADDDDRRSGSDCSLRGTTSPSTPTQVAAGASCRHRARGCNVTFAIDVGTPVEHEEAMSAPLSDDDMLVPSPTTGRPRRHAVPPSPTRQPNLGVSIGLVDCSTQTDPVCLPYGDGYEEYGEGSCTPTSCLSASPSLNPSNWPTYPTWKCVNLASRSDGVLLHREQGPAGCPEEAWDVGGEQRSLQDASKDVRMRLLEAELETLRGRVEELQEQWLQHGPRSLTAEKVEDGPPSSGRQEQRIMELEEQMEVLRIERDVAVERLAAMTSIAPVCADSVSQFAEPAKPVRTRTTRPQIFSFAETTEEVDEPTPRPQEPLPVEAHAVTASAMPCEEVVQLTPVEQAESAVPSEPSEEQVDQTAGSQGDDSGRRGSSPHFVLDMVLQDLWGFSETLAKQCHETETTEPRPTRETLRACSRRVDEDLAYKLSTLKARIGANAGNVRSPMATCTETFARRLRRDPVCRGLSDRRG